MSLKVWLPLDGDLRNQGLSSATFSKATNVWGTGKIGAQSLLTSTGTGSVMVNELKDKKEFSIAYWVKIDSSLTFSNWQDIWAVDYTNATGTYAIRDEHTSTAGNHQLLMAKETNVGSNTNGYIGMTIANAPDTWQHIVLVKGLTQTKSYINGELKLTRNNTDFETSNGKLTGNVRIGAATCGAYLNDFRIYDYCLSAAEVKEIAQGLVLHYKLDSGLFGNPNILTNSSGQLGTATGWTGLTTAGTMDGEPILITKRTDTESTSRTFCTKGNIASLITDWAAGDYYTMSGWYYVPSSETQQSGANMFIRWTYTNTSGTVTTTDRGFTTPLTVKDQWVRFEYTYQVPTGHTSDQAANYYLAAFAAQSLATVYWKKVKLEKGQVATPWCPADSELAINRNIIEDSSGYNHNGILTGNIIPQSDTAKYTTSLQYFTNSDLITIAPCFSTNQTIDTITVNCWFKTNTTNGTAPNIFCLGQNSFLRSRIASATSIWSYYRVGSTQMSETNSCKTLTDNIWHMLTFRFDKGIERIFIDGDPIGTQQDRSSTATYLTCASQNWYLGGYTGSSEKFIGSLSDFRIYCTPLLDTDIKQLYNVGMKVDKSQNIHAFDFTEQDGATQFKRTGVIETAQVSDDLLFDKKAHIGKKSYPNILENDIDIVTTKDSNVKKGTIASISAEQIQALAGKTLRLTYDVCADGDRSSTENGQTAYNYTRYGIHGSMAYTNGSGTTGTAYPFAGFLNYSGPATHAVQTWTVPTGYQTYGGLGFSIQNFDKPASTNNSTWFIQNIRLEIVETTSNGFVTGTQLIER